MTSARRTCLLAASLFFALQSYAQQEPVAALKPLAFLSGRWISDKPDEFQEETWSSGNGNSMIGDFRDLQNGKPVFYEFWVIEIDNGQPVLKLKHFNANLVGWEEKAESSRMPLVSATENEALFAKSDGKVSLHYRRNNNVLTCVVRHVRDGKNNDELFTLTRAWGN